ncbi:MAG: glycosyltransferase family 4 protein [Chloroflexi bacterium]|nr:glycosyltransferase family 4 protein [Chloroflexota bacterium]
MIAPTSFFADYGCHVRILEETLALQSLGHRVTICTYHTGDGVAGLDIRRSLDVPWRKGVQVGSSRHKLYFDAMLSMRTLATALTVRPHVVHAHLHEGALIGSVVARALGVPLLFDYQGSMTAEMLDHHFVRPTNPLLGSMRRLEHHLNRTADVVITSSHHAVDQLRQTGLSGVQARPLPDAVNTERFQPQALAPDERAELRARFGITPDRPVIVYLGLLAPYQGTDLLLQAAQRVVAAAPEAFFLIMGYPGVDTYARQAARLGLTRHTSFPGRIPYATAHRFLALGDIAVAPKLSATEGAGKIYNYIASGLPVVAFDTPVAREILGGDGYYAPSGNVEELANAILALVRNPAAARERTARLRRLAETDYSWRHRGRELDQIYHSLIARRQELVAAARS